MQQILETRTEGSSALASEITKFMEQYPLANFWINREGLQSISHVYSVPDLDIPAVKELFESSECFCEAVETKHFLGVYAEHGELSFFIYQPNPISNTLHFSDFNQSIDAELSREVVEWAKPQGLTRLINLNFETFKALLVTHLFAMSHIHSMDLEELKRLKAANSFKVLVDNYYHLTNGTPFDELSHLGCFAIIYHIELSVIAEIFSDSLSISLHDVATNTAHFPLLLNSLSREDVFGITLTDISCSDIDLDLPRRSIDNIAEFGEADHSNIQLRTLDLLDETERVKTADVITANDILEHFEESTSKAVLKNLWRMTNKLLVVHVPFEDQPCKQYGHLTAFNNHKLKEWAKELEGCLDVTDDYRYVANKYRFPHIYDQFLFLLKKE